MNSTNPPDSPQSPTIAPLWRRLAAMLYDSILVIAIWIVVGGIVLAIFGVDESRAQNGIMTELSLAHQVTLFFSLLLSPFLFFGFFWTHSGQTLGMQAWRIRVQNADGSAISWLQVVLRFGTAPFAFLVGGLGYLWMLFDARRRTLPDIVSNSQVVKI